MSDDTENNVVRLKDAADNVVPIGRYEVPQEGLDSMIRILEDTLERVRGGEVVGVALGCVHSDHAASYSICGMVGEYALIGALRAAENVLIESTCNA